jgi:hypothetical protein
VAARHGRGDQPLELPAGSDPRRLRRRRLDARPAHAQTLRRANSGSSVSALVLGPGGAFAYVSSGGGRVEVRRARRGRARRDPGIDPDSLAIAGAHVYWMRAAAPQSALLTP